MIYSKTEALQLIWTQVVLEDSQMMQEVLGNFGMGVFFALLGCSQMFVRLARDSAPKKPKRLSVSI